MTVVINGTTGITNPNSMTIGNGGGSVATNTAVGTSALAANTTGTRNTAIGYNSLNVATADYNTAVGYNSLLANTTGNLNTGVGDNALVSNTTGSGNSSVGQGALNNNTTGGSNTAVGRQALTSNTTASYNTAVGYQAGYTTTTGTGYNTFLGWQAGYALTTGAVNTLLGAGAGSAITTGSKNSVIGNYTGNQGGLDIRTASNYIVLSDGDGNYRAYSNGSGVWTFSSRIEIPSVELVVGGGTTPSIYRSGGNGSGIHFSTNSGIPTNESGSVSDNSESWGTSSYRWSVIYAATGTINTSDQNQKQDIQDLSASELAVAQEIKTLFKTFRWKDAVAQKGNAARIHVGVIAQDVQAAFAKHGLDSSRYALFCSDTWHEVDGKGISDDGTPYTHESDGAVEKTRLGIRYDQLLAFVIAAM